MTSQHSLETLSKFENDLNARVSFAQQGEDLVAERILTRSLGYKLKEGGFYLDIGSHHPIQDSVTHRLHLQGWEGIGCDISQQSYDLFEQFRNSGKFINLKAAISDIDGEITAYYTMRNSQDTKIRRSLIHTCDPSVAANLRRKGISIREEKISSFRVVSLIEKYKPEATSIDFINIDVEGLELQVLHGINFDKIKPALIACEIHASNISNVLNSPVAQYLRSHGYQLMGSTVITHFFAIPK